MNYSVIIYILGIVLKFEAAFLSLPLLVAVLYREKEGFAFFGSMLLCYALGFIAQKIGKKETLFYAKEGFIIVAFSWILISIFGAFPFYFSGDIPSFTDALFETISGFTTTGSSILSDVEALSRSGIFWRSFTHWIGGMGVLVFILAVLPLAGGYHMHLIKAESPGPQVGKLVPKIRSMAKILYGIYVILTVVQVILLLFGGMSLFDSLTISFGTAGTGGFGIRNDSLASYSPYIQVVVAVFMVIFGVNFNVYYLWLINKGRQAIKSEEVRTYLLLIATATLFITFNIRDGFGNIAEALRHAFFQVASVMTSTGYATFDYNYWPEASKALLLMVMFVGACAGSTGGGIKVSRVLLGFKMAKREIMAFVHPKRVKAIKLEGKTLGQEVISSVAIFLVVYAIIFIFSFFALSFNNYDFATNFTAVAATLNNTGPGFAGVGPAENFGFYSIFSKYVLMFDMLAGRLEIFPMLVLFAPGTWRR